MSPAPSGAGAGQGATTAAPAADFDPATIADAGDVLVNTRSAAQRALSSKPAGATFRLAGGVRIVAGQRPTSASHGSYAHQRRLFRVHHPDGSHEDLIGLDLAVQAALHASAKSTAPGSLGGSRSLGDYREAKLTPAQRTTVLADRFAGWAPDGNPVVGRPGNFRRVLPDGSRERDSYMGATYPVRVPLEA